MMLSCAIHPDKPTQNGFIENLYGQFRNKCMNELWMRYIIRERESLINGGKIIMSVVHIQHSIIIGIQSLKQSGGMKI